MNNHIDEEIINEDISLLNNNNNSKESSKEIKIENNKIEKIPEKEPKKKKH